MGAKNLQRSVFRMARIAHKSPHRHARGAKCSYYHNSLRKDDSKNRTWPTAAAIARGYAVDELVSHLRQCCLLSGLRMTRFNNSLSGKRYPEVVLT